MADDSEEEESAYGRPPAEGERSAVIGFVPQYEVAAALTLRTLTDETLEWIALLDPAAGRLDDFQVATPGRLDALQIKWSGAGGQMTWSEIKNNLADLLRDREPLANNNQDRRVYAHLHTNQVPSNTRFAKTSQSPATAVAELLRPATEGKFATIDDIPGAWRELWVELAKGLGGLTEQELLEGLALVVLDFGQPLPTSVDVPGRDGERYRRDLREIRGALFDTAIDASRPVRISRDELIGRLPGDWAVRLALRSAQEFAAPAHYEPIRATVDALSRAIDEHVTGYVGLVGSPGSGKSTLLSQELRGRGDVVARYYAYVRGRGDLGTIRGDAAAFLHDLVLTLERGGLPRGPAPVDFDIAALTRRLERHLEELGRRYAENGERAIVMVDGLDHVEREVEGDKSLLRYLPTELPDGVLFVVGSQSVKMLDPAIRVQLGEVGRTVTMQGLNREGTARLVAAAGVGVDPGAVYETTRGHPLLVDYVLRELADIDPVQREQHLASMPPYGGDVLVLYERLWSHMASDAELIELLALASRIRVAVDVGWLRDCGQSPAVVRRLRDKLAHLFRRQDERWHFFHDSFRVFLQRRTTMAGPRDEPDPAEDRRYHRELAAMCRATAEPHPMAWEALFHLAAADEHRTVLDLAQPGYFRSQTLALRPPELIAADIRMAARSLAVEHDPMALVRLAIAGGELAQRGYHLPEREELVDILFGTGRWQTVVDLMDAEREGFGTDDSRTLRLSIAARLHRMGHAEEGRRMFEANEPLELLRGGDLARPARGPFKLLYRWAEAAVLFREPDAVIEAVARVHVPPDRVLGHGRREQDQTEAVRAWMLAHAGSSAAHEGRSTAADAVQAQLEPANEDHLVPWVWLQLQRARPGVVGTANPLDLLLATVRPELLDAGWRLFVADTLAHDKRFDDARAWIDGLGQPPLNDSASLQDLWGEELSRYRLARMRALFGDRPDPDDEIPPADADHRWGYVHIARIVIAIATLDGMAWAGDALTPAQFLAESRRIFRRLGTTGPDWIVASTLRRIRAQAVAELLVVAHRHGPEVASAVWEEIERRWDESPWTLTVEGHRVLPVALDGGVIPGQAVRARFGRLVDALTETTEAQEMGRALGEAALTAIKLSEPGEAWRMLERSVASSLAVYERKDYQLGDWIDMLGPLLERDGGAALARWLCGALAELRRDTGGAQANAAAQPLLRGESERRPGHAWRIGQWLEDEQVVDRDDRQLGLLAASSAAADGELWWTVLADGTVPIAADALGNELVLSAQRAAAKRGAGWVAARLRIIVERARVEGPPDVEAAWREAVADAAAACGIAVEELGLAADEHPDRRRPRTRMRGTGEAERDAFLAAHATLEELIAGAAAAGAEGKHSEWSEALELVGRGLDRAGVELVRAHSDRVDDLLTLAERAAEIGANDLARELAEEVVSRAEPRGWRRHWDGGTLLRALLVLFRLDPAPARELAYRRFAADASTDQFLLSELVQDLAQYLDLFGVDDRLALAEEVHGYVRVLVRDPSPLPTADGVGDGRSLDEVLAAALLDLLAAPHRLAVTTAQRALVTAVRDGSAATMAAIVAALGSSDEELALRIVSVLETVGGAALGAEVVDAVEIWAAADDLALRVASRLVVSDAGRTPPALPERALPAAYKLIVPSAETPPGMAAHAPLGADDLARVAAGSAGELEALAELAGVDLGLLEARVEQIARLKSPVAGVEVRSQSVLGWSAYPPEIVRWDRAALSAAAELVDAGCLDAETALNATFGRLCDPALIGRRPATRPEAVPGALAGHTRDWVTQDGWLDDLAGAESRLAHDVGGWVVIAEQTDVRYLDRDMPRERRWQRIAPADDDRAVRPPRLRPLRVEELGQIRAGVGEVPILRHESLPYRGPSAWLALHPQLARVLGLRACRDDQLSYCGDDGQLRIRSLWWRRGWLDSSRWTTHDEVGEGWLVVADPAILPELGRVFGPEMRVVWEVERDFVVSGNDRRRQLRGHRTPRMTQ